jgi:hypothetical protein
MTEWQNYFLVAGFVVVYGIGFLRGLYHESKK